MPVLFTDVKKGDRVFFRIGKKDAERLGVKDKIRTGTVRSLNRQRQTIIINFDAPDICERRCSWYFKASDIIGFHLI